jgi:hypothetical protein
MSICWMDAAGSICGGCALEAEAAEAAGEAATASIMEE